MPYLHWETDRARSKASRIIKKNGPSVSSNLACVTEAIIDVNTRHSSSNTKQPNRNVMFYSRRELHKSKWSRDQKPLGKILLLAASLYEAMDEYTDEKLLKEYLSVTPALHPRRTLAQSYYWTLKDTDKTDRDQVVYRATAPSPGSLHHKCEKNDNDPPCSKCSENISKTPRLIMVDQLWLWILDNSKSGSNPSRVGRLTPHDYTFAERD